MNDRTLAIERRIPVPGGSLFAKSWTPSSVHREPLVLFHDSLGCIATWRDFPERLAEATNRQVIAYDRLGFGRSSARKELPSVLFVTEESDSSLPALLDAFQIDSFSCFGHSVGGAMAVVTAGHFKDRCRAVVTESAQAFIEERTRQGISRAREDFKNPELFRKLEKHHGDKTQWVLDAWIKVWLSEDFADWSLVQDLPKMRCPVLALHGDRDEYGSTKFPELICDLAGGPSELRLLENCGHVPHREYPDQVLTIVSRFLAG